LSPRAATKTTAPDAARPLGTWRSRILGSSEEDLAQLLANPRNWRIHTTAQRKALRGALDTVGWVQQGEGLTAPRHLRADHGGWANDHVGAPDTLGVRARIGAGPASGCYGAPDRIRARVSNLRDPDRGAG
jgi:hypothetical protein